MEEVEYQCPYCWETQTIVVDTSCSHQEYVEDCYVCCRPINFIVTIDQIGEITVLAEHEDEA